MGSSVRLHGKTGRPAPRALSHVLGDRVDAHVTLGAGRLAAAGQFHDVADQAGQLVELGDHVLAQRVTVRRAQTALVAHELQVRPQGGDRRTELVRSIGNEVAL